MPKSERIERVRVTVDFSARLMGVIDRLSTQADTTQTNTIRSAAQLLVEVDKLEREGFKTGGYRYDAQGRLETVRVIIV